MHVECMGKLLKYIYFKAIPVCNLSDVSCFSSSLQISDSELLHWKEHVAKCMVEYRSSECNKPDNKKLVWIVSRRTAQNLQTSHFSVPGLPTIPERSWDESERLIVNLFYFLCVIMISRVCWAPWKTKWDNYGKIRSEYFPQLMCSTQQMHSH